MAITIDDLKSTIKIEFDGAGNPIQPIFVLAERNTEKLGVIENTAEFNITGNLNAADEFSFTVYKYFNGNKCTLWDSIQNLCLIWVKEWDRWFQIKVDTNESDAVTKKIEATSLSEAELSQIYLFETEINTEDDIARDDYVEPTVFYNSEDSTISLLDRISEKIPHYTIEYVAPTLANIQRTFEFNETTIYDALQEISEEIECIFILGSGSNDSGNPERTISAYDLCDSCDDCGYRGTISDGVCPDCGGTNITYGYGYDSMIFVDSDSLGDEIEITVDTDGYKTCFRLQSGDDLMDAAIAACNPNGSRYIWYFDDDTRASMSEELQAALAEYDEKYSSFEEITDDEDDTYFGEYNDLVDKYVSDDLSVSTITSITSFAELMQIYYDTIDFQLYLQSSYMPSVNTDELADINNQLAEINALEYSTIGINVTLSNLNFNTAKSYVLTYVKTFVRQAYFDVSISGFSYAASGANSCKAIIKITSVSDEDTYATTGNLTFYFSNDYELYVQQKIEKTISNNSNDDESDTLIAMFESDIDDFKTTLKKHCLDNLNSYYNMCQTILDVLISYGMGSSDSEYYTTFYSGYYAKLNAIATEISTREEEISIITTLQEFLTKKRTAIQESLNFESFFGEDLWKELCSYRREQTYDNSNFVSTGLDNAELVAKALEFIELAQDELYSAGTFQVSITTELKNLLAIPEFESLVENFAVGVWIYVKIDDTIYKLRLISYSIDFDNFDNITVEFSDAVKVKNGLTDTQSVLEQTINMATSYDYVAYQASKVASNTTFISGWVNDGLDATTVMLANSLDNQDVVFDEHGILVRQWDDVLEDYVDKQIKIINKGLYFTDDNWEHVRTGVGNFIYYDPEEGTYVEGYGVIADTIVANIILSEKVGIYNTNNSITMDYNGLTVTGSYDADGDTNLFLLRKDNGDGTYEDLMYFDNAGNLVIDGASVTITASALGDILNSYYNYLDNYNFGASGTWVTSKDDYYYTLGYYDPSLTYIVDYSWYTGEFITGCQVKDITTNELTGLTKTTQCLCLSSTPGETNYGQLIQDFEIPNEGTCKFTIKLGVNNNYKDYMNKIGVYANLINADDNSSNDIASFTLTTSNSLKTYTSDTFDVDEAGDYRLVISFDVSEVDSSVLVEGDDVISDGDFSKDGYEVTVSDDGSGSMVCMRNSYERWIVNDDIFDNVDFKTITSSNLSGLTASQQMLSLQYESVDEEEAYIMQSLSISKSGNYKIKISQGQDLQQEHGDKLSCYARISGNSSVSPTWDGESSFTLTTTYTTTESDSFYLTAGKYNIYICYTAGTNDPTVDIGKIELIELTSDIDIYVSKVECLGDSTESITKNIATLSVETDLITAAVEALTGESYKSTSVSLSSEMVQVAWNNVSNVIQFKTTSSGVVGLYIQESDSSTADTLVSLTSEGLTVYDGAISVLDESGDKVFYTDSDGNITFSGNFSIGLTPDDDSSSSSTYSHMLRIDENGLFVCTYGGNYSLSYDNAYPSVGFNCDRRDARLQFYYFEDVNGYINIPVGKIYADYFDTADVLGGGYDLYIYSWMSPSYFTDATAQGAVRIEGKSAALRVGYSYISYTGTLSGNSDYRLKENIENLDEETSVAIINALNPVSFNFKSDEDKKINYGFIAQDVEKVFEDNNIETSTLSLIRTPDSNNTYYGLTYDEFIPLLVKTVQYQQKQIEELQEKINQITQ